MIPRIWSSRWRRELTEKFGVLVIMEIGDTDDDSGAGTIIDSQQSEILGFSECQGHTCNPDSK